MRARRTDGVVESKFKKVESVADMFAGSSSKPAINGNNVNGKRPADTMLAVPAIAEHRDQKRIKVDQSRSASPRGSDSDAAKPRAGSSNGRQTKSSPSTRTVPLPSASSTNAKGKARASGFSNGSHARKPVKQRRYDDDEEHDDDNEEGGESGYGHSAAAANEIWAIFGKDRAKYTARDAYSDSEGSDDMEADAHDVMREELRANKAAQLEEQEQVRKERQARLDKQERLKRMAAAAKK